MSSTTITLITSLLAEFSTRENRLKRENIHYFPENHWSMLRSLKVSWEDFAYLYNVPITKDNDMMDTEPIRSSPVDYSLPALIMRHVPFFLTTDQKVMLFHTWLKKEHEDQGRSDPSRGVEMIVRRNYMVQDSFKHVMALKGNARQYFKVEFINQEGLKEAGVGGGVFKEFLTSLIREAFAPQYGLYLTTTDGYLYPNRSAHTLQDTIEAKFEFLGIITGKLIYERNLAELPLANFFIKQVLLQPISLADVYDFDPEVYRHLKSIQNLLEDEIPELGLTFSGTHIEPVTGKVISEEYIPGGNNVEVYSRSHVEGYIKAWVYGNLVKSISTATLAFRRGLLRVLPVNWVSLFDVCEFQWLISGNLKIVDLEDLIANTKYSNGYHVNHETIQLFWLVVQEFTNEQLSALLKFVTSCSRAPLLGFKTLDPPFCIHKSSIGYLPSATTCVNQLKLPPYNDFTVLKEKLLYAISSKSGFELS